MKWGDARITGADESRKGRGCAPKQYINGWSKPLKGAKNGDGIKIRTQDQDR